MFLGRNLRLNSQFGLPAAQKFPSSPHEEHCAEQGEEEEDGEHGQQHGEQRRPGGGGARGDGARAAGGDGGGAGAGRSRRSVAEHGQCGCEEKWWTLMAARVKCETNCQRKYLESSELTLERAHFGKGPLSKEDA